MNSAMSTRNILASGDRLQVIRPDTVARVAEMVECQSFGDGAAYQLIGPAMGADRFVVDREDTITVDLSTFVNPTRAEMRVSGEGSLIDLRPKALLGARQWNAIWHTVTLPVCVMAATHAFVVGRLSATFNTAWRCWTADRPSVRSTSKRITVILPAVVMCGAPAATYRRLGAIFNGTHQGLHAKVTPSLYALNLCLERDV